MTRRDREMAKARARYLAAIADRPGRTAAEKLIESCHAAVELGAVELRRETGTRRDYRWAYLYLALFAAGAVLLVAAVL